MAPFTLACQNGSLHCRTLSCQNGSLQCRTLACQNRSVLYLVCYLKCARLLARTLFLAAPGLSHSGTLHLFYPLLTNMMSQCLLPIYTATPEHIQQSTSYPLVPPTAQQGSSCPPDIYLAWGTPLYPLQGAHIENVCSVLRECRILIKKGKYTLLAIKLAHKVIYRTEMMNKVSKIEQLPSHLTDFLKSVMR